MRDTGLDRSGVALGVTLSEAKGAMSAYAPLALLGVTMLAVR
jgi:hypothetical protein